MTDRVSWVFGYGSLLWRPGFPFEACHDAELHGYHRDMCITSVVHRGTPDVPGLVAGLQPGGTCHGRAYKVAPDKWDDVIAYLDERELVNDVYLRITHPVKLGSGSEVHAVCYVADTEHHQYAGHLSEADRVALIKQGIGPEGTSLDYLSGIVDHLAELGIEDPGLNRLLHLSA